MSLRQENRPFSVQNIVDALQKNGVKKTAVERSLASLVEKGTVSKKEYGKAKIFILAQDKIELPDPEEVKQLDEEIKSLTDDLSQATERVNAHRTKLSALKKEYTLEEAKARNAQLAAELTEKDAKRNALGDGSKLTSKEDKLKLEQNYYDTKLLWKRYKRIVKDIAGHIGEATGKKNSELFEDMAVETDESVNIKISDFPDIQNPSKSRRVANPKRAIKRQRQN